MNRAWLAPVALMAAQPALADSVAIPFAPPTDRLFDYRIDQRRMIGGQASRFTSRRDVRFQRDGRDFVLIGTLRTADTDAPPAMAEPYHAALQPLIGVEMRFTLDASGRIVTLANMDQVWTKVTTGLAAMGADAASDSVRFKSVQRVQALFDSLSPAGRMALLAGEFQPLLVFAGTQVQDGAGRGLRTVAGSPLGRPVPVSGSSRLLARSPDALDLEEKLAGDGGVTVSVRYRISPITGLVDHQVRALAVGASNLVETRILEAGN